jgi:hypothetical protein
MDDSALLLALVFAAIVLLLIVAAVVVRATSTDQGAERGERPGGREGHDPRADGQSPGAEGTLDAEGHVHRDPDPDRLAGGRASTHSH